MAIGDVGLTSSMRSNLASLQSTARLMGSTEEKLASGKRVNTAVDNPANFFAARGHETRANLMTGLKDNISEAIQTVKAADAGIKGVLSTIESLRGIVTQARSALNDSTTSDAVIGTAADEGLAGQYNRLVGQMNNLVEDANYKGTNFLSGSTSMTVNLNENASTTIVMSGFDSSASGLAISGGENAIGKNASGDIDASTLGATGANGLDGIEASLNAAIATLQTKASELASNLSTLTARQTFISDMTNILSMGATKLTEADTNEEGANLLALQTKQQLGTTAMSISSQAEQGILRLF